LATVCATTFYFLFPKFVLGVFFGDKYLDVASYLGWFAVMVSLFSFSHLFIQYLLSIQKTRAAFYFLAIALVEILAIFFFANSIYTIVSIVIIIQIMAILTGLYFILSDKNKTYE
jgi:O-antigen/teichoic acid export membrane protein